MRCEPEVGGLQPARGALLRKAGGGARPLAFDESAAEEGAGSYLGLLAQPSGGQPTSATSEAPTLNLHIGLTNGGLPLFTLLPRR